MDLEMSVTQSVQCLYGILLFQFQMGRIETPLLRDWKCKIIEGAEDGRREDV